MFTQKLQGDGWILASVPSNAVLKSTTVLRSQYKRKHRAKGNRSRNNKILQHPILDQDNTIFRWLLYGKMPISSADHSDFIYFWLYTLSNTPVNRAKITILLTRIKRRLSIDRSDFIFSDSTVWHEKLLIAIVCLWVSLFWAW